MDEDREERAMDELRALDLEAYTDMRGKRVLIDGTVSLAELRQILAIVERAQPPG